jgi:hypothetical protein
MTHFLSRKQLFMSCTADIQSACTGNAGKRGRNVAARTRGIRAQRGADILKCPHVRADVRTKA